MSERELVTAPPAVTASAPPPRLSTRPPPASGLGHGRRVLVVDDEPGVRRAIARALLARGIAVDTAESGPAALDLLRGRPVDAVLLDHDMPEMSGLATLARMRREHPGVEVVVLVPLGEPAASVAAIAAGAFAVLATPLQAPEIAVALAERAADKAMLLARAAELERRVAEHEQLGEIVASSARMVDLLRRATAAAASSAPVLVLGERGTGKGLLARSIHKQSGRARAPLVAWSPAALPEEEAAGELARALDRAHGGTLVVEDLEALPPAAQAALVEALVEARADRDAPRIVACAVPELRDRVARGDVREDLFYRLAAVLLEVPPLRRRREDVPLLAYHFVSRIAPREGKTIRRIGAEALRALRDHAWPGNVGELASAIEHAVVMARGETIAPADLPLGRRASHDGGGDDDEPAGTVVVAKPDVLELPYGESKERASAAFDRAYVARCMKAARGNVSEAARLAGMDRSNFRRLAKKAGHKPKAPKTP